MQHTGFAFLGMELKIESPVFAGDTIHVECEVIEARLSKSRPGRGLVRTLNQVVKQDGTVGIDLHAAAHDQVPTIMSENRATGPGRRRHQGFPTGMFAASGRASVDIGRERCMSRTPQFEVTRSGRS